MNVRWGVTQTMTLNATVNPDFSQVEADAGQFQFDPRQALFFPAKRPFSMDGIELEDREFIAAIEGKRAPNGSLEQLLPCMRVLGKLEQIIDPQRKAHA